MNKFLISGFIYKLEHILTRQIEHARPYAIVLGWLGVFAHPLWHFYWAYSKPLPFNVDVYESFTLRTIGFFSMLILALHNRLPQIVKNYSAILYTIIIIFNFPYFETLYLLQKSPNDPSLGAYEMTFVATLVIFALLTNISLYIWGLIIGIGAAGLTYIIINPNPSLPYNFSSVVDVSIYCVIFGGIFTFNNRIYRTRNYQAMILTCNKIFHEIKTPLLSIVMIIGTTLDHLKQSEDNPNRIIKNLSTIRKLSLDIKYLIELISNNIKSMTGQNYQYQIETFSVKNSLSETIENYPFNTQRERDLINIQINYDFYSRLIPVLFQNVIFNLIRNALTEIHKKGQGKLNIHTRQEENYNILSFESTSGPINPKIKHLIFDPGYSTNQGHLGLGLNFCKEVMTGVGGKITCNSTKISAIFELHFPKSLQIPPPPNK